jgi:hypothetical protein
MGFRGISSMAPCTATSSATALIKQLILKHGGQMVGFVAAHTGTITVYSWWLYHNDPSTLCYAFSKSVYLFIYLKKFWFVHKYPIVLCRLRMSMDHLEVIMCIYITCLIQSENTSGIMSSFIRQMERLWRILRMGAFKVVEFTQVCLTNSKTCVPVT